MNGAYCQQYFQILLCRIKNNRRKVVGSESDLLVTLSREANQNQRPFTNNHHKRVTPMIKSHSDWGLVAVPDDMLSYKNQRNDHVKSTNRIMGNVLKEPVYSIPDISTSNPHMMSNQSSSRDQLQYYSPTTNIPSSPHETFRVCLLISD